MSFQQTAQFFLTWGGQPLIGAFIGYLTNDIAIRMLFRPLTPWRIFGLRLPLTPGIIPSKRQQLAENIGEMVGGQLLTSKDIGEAMSSERFQEHLRRLAEDKLNSLLEEDIGPLFNLVPQPLRIHAKIGLRSIKHRLRSSILSYLASPVLGKHVSVILAAQIRSAGGRKLEELLRSEDRQGLYVALEQVSKELLTTPEAAAQLGNWLGQSLRQAAESGKTVGELLPVGLHELACALAADQAAPVLAQLAAIMAEPAMRDRVVQAIKGGVDHFLDNLGPMAAMAKGFLNLQSLDSLIHNWLSNQEGSLETWLQQPEIEARAAQALREQVAAFFAQPLAVLLARIGPERLDMLCQQTATQLLAALTEETLQQRLSVAIRAHIEELLEHGQLSLAALADKLPTESRRRLRHSFLTELQAITASEPVRRQVSKLTNSLLDQLAARPRLILRDLLPATVRSSIAEQLVVAINRLLIREVPGLTESLRIRELVRNKVDSLDLLRLERLLLSIMEEQFKYINLFGALLGFLIGLLNVLLLRWA